MMAEEALAQLRICSKCGVEKPLEEFVANKQSRQGRERQCKECAHAAARQRWAAADKARIKQMRDAWYAKGGAENKRAWTAKNPDKVKASKKRSAQKHSQQNVDRVRQWRKKNPEQRRAQARAEAARRRASPRGRLDHTMSTALNAALRNTKGGRRWSALVGYTVGQLMTHLERNFLPGMSWDNYGEWHVDHIIPKSAFNYAEAGQIDFARCWALTNLQPLWAKENMVKGSKLIAPFQPSLAI